MSNVYSGGGYATIYADPPWLERGGGVIKRGADRHYPLMKTAEILAMAEMVQDMAAPNAHLYLWATNNFMPDALAVMKAWGFRYVTCITWAKPRIGLGQYFRGQTEHCLFGVRGSLPYRTREDGKRAQGTTLIDELDEMAGGLFEAPVTEHSAKPAQMRRWIEAVSHGPRIELFARQPVAGWDVWGLEADGSRIKNGC